jgi:hypothetical protein
MRGYYCIVTIFYRSSLDTTLVDSPYGLNLPTFLLFDERGRYYRIVQQSKLTLVAISRHGISLHHSTLTPPRGNFGPIGHGDIARWIGIGRVARYRLLVQGVEFETVAVLLVVCGKRERVD